MRFIKLALAGLCALGLVAAAATADAAPVKIRMSWVAPLANWGSIILYKKDLMHNLGKTYTLETVHFRGTPPMITAVANNELEVVDFAYSSLAIAIENAGLDDLRVIAGEFQDGVPGYYSEQYYVRKDSGIDKVEQLKGKVVASNAAGSAVDIAIRAMLHKHGLEPKRDYTIIESPLPSMPAVLLEKKAALVPIVLPFAFNPKLKVGGKVLFTQDQALGKTQMLIFAARESFIKAHRAAMVDFMTDLLRVVHWYLNPTNHEAVEKIASKLTKGPAGRFGWLFTKQDNYRDPNMVPDLAALQRNVDTVQQLGFVKKHLDIKSHSDLSLLHEAIARLKKSNGN